MDKLKIYNQCKKFAEETFKYSDYESEIFDTLCECLNNECQVNDLYTIKIQNYAKELIDIGGIEDRQKAKTVLQALDYINSNKKGDSKWDF